MARPLQQQTAAQALSDDVTATSAEPDEAPAWLSWASAPVFGGASLVQIALLIAIGAVWSGSIWLIVDRIKNGLDLQKPYTPKTRHLLTFTPLLASIVVCMFAFPAALSLVGVEYTMDPPWAVLGFAGLCGIIAWASAKLAHDFWGEVLKAARQAIINRIRGLGGKKVPGYTADHDTVTNSGPDHDDND